MVAILGMPSSPVIRRSADPLSVQWLWSAIAAIRSQKQIANEDRIIRHIHRENGEAAGQAAASQLRKAVEDGLVIKYSALAQKGSPAAGSEQDAYRVPEDELVSKVSA